MSASVARHPISFAFMIAPTIEKLCLPPKARDSIANVRRERESNYSTSLLTVLQFRDESYEVRRERHFPVHDDFGDGMHEAEFGGVECESRCAVGV